MTVSQFGDRGTIRRAPMARRARALLPFVLIVAMLIAFFALPAAAGTAATTFNVYNALQNWSALALLALGIGLTMIAGEFDLGAVGIYAFAGMVAVKVGEQNAVLGIVAAVLVGAGIGLLQGVLVARLRIDSMPVTLGFYIALLGATAAISNSVSVPFSNFDVGAVLDSPIGVFFSVRSVATVALFVAVILAMRFTRLGREIRAVGGDRRSSRVVGVGVDKVIVGVFLTSGICAAVGGSLLAYSLATALPDPGPAPLTFAITAALIGGVTLAGGVGGGLGIAAGAFSLCLLQELLSILAMPSYVTNLVTGGLLVVATIIAAPDLIARWKSLRAPRPRPVVRETAPRAAMPMRPSH